MTFRPGRFSHHFKRLSLAVDSVITMFCYFNSAHFIHGKQDDSLLLVQDFSLFVISFFNQIIEFFPDSESISYVNNPFMVAVPEFFSNQVIVYHDWLIFDITILTTVLTWLHNGSLKSEKKTHFVAVRRTTCTAFKLSLFQKYI